MADGGLPREASGRDRPAAADLATLDPRAVRDLPGDMRPGVPAAQSRPGVAQQIAVQMAEAVRGAAGRSVEVSLNPAELGHVRLTLGAVDGTMVVQVAAERGETLDLMRRHSDLLAQEFRQSGYGGTQFDFTGNAERPPAWAQPAIAHDAPDCAATPTAVPHAPPVLRMVVTDRVDIRL